MLLTDVGVLVVAGFGMWSKLRALDGLVGNCWLPPREGEVVWMRQTHALWEKWAKLWMFLVLKLLGCAIKFECNSLLPSLQASCIVRGAKRQPGMHTQRKPCLR